MCSSETGYVLHQIIAQQQKGYELIDGSGIIDGRHPRHDLSSSISTPSSDVSTSSTTSNQPARPHTWTGHLSKNSTVQVSSEASTPGQTHHSKSESLSLERQTSRSTASVLSTSSYRSANSTPPSSAASSETANSTSLTTSPLTLLPTSHYATAGSIQPFCSVSLNRTGAGFGPPPCRIGTSVGGGISTPDPTSRVRECTPIIANSPITKFLIVHTSTITINGNLSDYTPPFAAISTPTYCTSPTDRKPNSGQPPFQTSSEPAPAPGTSDLPMQTSPFRSSHYVTPSTTITFITTAAGPSVVVRSDPTPPNYSQSWLHQTHDGHVAGSPMSKALPNTLRQTHELLLMNSVASVEAPTFTVTAGGSEVTINTVTITGLRPGQTTVVTVGGGTFTIEPTAVVGEGVSIEKPSPATAPLTVPTPTSTNLDGISVVVSGSVAIVGGSRFHIPTSGVVTTMGHDRISVGPGAIVVGSETLTFDAAPHQNTDVVVAGGEMLTAIGQSVLVLHSTTLTYGVGITATSEVVDNDTVTIGPSGVVIDGTTLGGLSAAITDTSMEIVGGATLTELGASLVVVDNKTFTAGPKAHEITTVYAGETITIGQEGIIVSGVTFTYPFMPRTVRTFQPSGTWLDHFPQQTGQQEADEGDDSAGVSLRCGIWFGWKFTIVCAAMGVWLLI